MNCPRCDAPPVVEYMEHHGLSAFTCGTIQRGATLHVAIVCSERAPLARQLKAAQERIAQLESVGDVLNIAIGAADDDIREHLQVANYNLHGLMNTGERVTPPNPPQTVHQAGIDASVRVRESIRLARLAWFKVRKAKP